MKKLLALVLALVMTMGLATVATNAAFPDASDVTLTEAADVMTAVGVFQGNESGSFLPTANLDRQSAAKLIAYLALGKTAAEAIPATQVFPDVPADNWAAKYVAYCKNAGYISGDQNGNFLPTTELNGYSFGKMVLCVLGYDPEIEGMTGSSWSINIAKLLQSNDITDGVDTAASATLTREQAAQYCLNALKATTVEYDTKGTSIEINGAKIATGASKASNVTSDAAYAYAIKGTAGQTNTVQLGESLYNGDLKLDGGDDNKLGQPAKKWIYKNAEVGTYAKGADSTLKNGLTYGDIYTAIGSTVAKNLKSLTLKIDGKTVVSTDANKAYVTSNLKYTLANFANAKGDTKAFKYMDSTAAYNADNAFAVAGNGSTTTIYVEENGTEYDVTICAVNSYVAKVDSVNAADAKNNRSITLKSKFGGVSFKTYETEEFAKNDILLVTAYDNGTDYEVQTAKALNSTGAVHVDSTTGIEDDDTFVTGGSFAVSGTTYKYSLKAPKAAKVVGSSSYELYLDDEGYVLYADEVEETSNSYLMVISSGTYKKADELSGSGATNKSKVVFDDGTTKTITVSKRDGNKFSSDSVDGPTEVKPTDYAIYKYVEQSDGTYSLTSVTTTAITSGKVTKGFTNISGSTSISGGATTKYVYLNAATGHDAANDGKYKTSWTLYTGYTNSKTVTDAKISAFKDTSATRADVVFVYEWKAGEAESSVKDYIFLLGKTPTRYPATDDADEYYTFNAIVKGEIGTVKADVASPIADGSSLANATLYTVEYTDGSLGSKSMTQQTESAKYTNLPAYGDAYKWNVFTPGTISGTSTLKVELSDDGDLLTFTGNGIVAAGATSISVGSDSFGFSSDCKVFVMDDDGGNAGEITINGISSGNNAYSKIVAITQAMKEGSPTTTQRNTIIELYLVRN